VQPAPTDGADASPADNRRLRILHVTAASEAGGLSRYIYDLCLAMHRLGHEVAVAGARGAWHAMFEKAPFRWIECPLSKGPVGLWKSCGILKDYLRQHPVDVIHTHYRRATLIGRRLQSADNRPPLVYTVHLSDMPLPWPQRFWKDFGDHIHAPSQEARRWLIEDALVEAAKISLIPHGIDPDKFPYAERDAKLAARAQFELTPDDRVAVYVGRIEAPKNEDWLLDVAEASRESIPNLKILVAGAGPNLHEFRHQIIARGLQERVISLGERDPLPVYQAADAMLLPSRREGFSLATAEAMSVGVPVLRTRTAGAAELIVEGVSGRSVPIEHDAFVKGAVEFLRDGEALARMSRSAAQHVRENYTFDRQLQATLRLYAALTAQGAAVRRPAPVEAGA
jgi:glycosyltransferase involved in cell wall biosynthesis